MWLQTKVNGWRKIYQANSNQKKARLAILTSDRADFRVRIIIKDKEGHCIMIKGSVLQEDIIIFNVYVPNNRVSNYMKQIVIELQGE